MGMELAEQAQMRRITRALAATHPAYTLRRLRNIEAWEPQYVLLYAHQPDVVVAIRSLDQLENSIRSGTFGSAGQPQPQHAA